MNDKNKTPLGKIFLKQKLVDASELEMLLDEQKIDKKRLASKVLEKGLADEVSLLKALSEQHGMPGINLADIDIELSQLNMIPRDIALKHLVLPISASDDTIFLAMANPDDRRVVQEIEFVSGKRIFPHVALHSQLSAAIENCYAASERGEKVFRSKPAVTSFSDTAEIPVSPGIVHEGSSAMVIADMSPSDDLSFDIDIEIANDDPPSPPAMASREAVGEAGSAPVSLGENFLQFSSIPSPSPLKPPQRSQRTGILKVLVVDDEDDIRLLISRILSDKGYEVITASRGLEAIQIVQTNTPDMLVLDAMLPEVHGFDICKKIKGSSKYGHIPVIMISAIYRGWRYAQDLKDSYGVDDFIEKPFKIAELISKVEKHARLSYAPRENDTNALSEEAERSLAAGINAYREGNIEEAIDLLKKGVSIDPLAHKLHYHLALLLGKSGLHYQAIRSLENALELVPDFFPALKNLAVLYQKAGFKFKAIETWERALGFCNEEETREGIKKHLVNLL